MQPEHQHLQDSNSTLRFPVLSGNDNLTDWLEHSHLVPSKRRTRSMASHTDDSSVDESLSSLGESAWDVVDERSAASDDDDARNISRQPTPFSEVPERVLYDVGSLAGNDTSSESQGLRSRLIEFSHSRKDSSSDPPDTAKQTVPVAKRASLQQNEGIPYIKFQEQNNEGNTYHPIQDVSSVLTEFEGREKKQLVDEYRLNPKLEVAGTIRQQMRKDGLVSDGPFKVLYVGASEMKETIVSKVASALAANHGSTPRDSLHSSRVTVVPISSFIDDSSPDVVLIDSMGLDMNIEECRSAINVKGEDWQDSIELRLSNHKTIKSFWNPGEHAFTIAPDYTLPDLAVVYMPERENSAAKRTRAQARTFLSRHEVPTLVISSNLEWKPTSPVAVDYRLPHLCIESFDPESGAARILRRQPIDVNTFVSVDSAQFSRSLALLAPVLTLDQEDFSEKLLQDSSFHPSLPREKEMTSSQKPRISLQKAGYIAVFLLACVAVWAQLFAFYGQLVREPPLMDTVPEILTTSRVAVASPSTTPTMPSTLSSTATETRQVLLQEVHDQVIETLSALANGGFESNKSDTFEVQVVGDSHVILKPPTWFQQLKKAPELQFRVQRQRKRISYEFSTLFPGVYALKLPPEDAHGVLDISVWTTQKPKLNQTFQVEFGTPWLKVSGWQRAAQAMTEQVRDELVAAQTGLFKAYVHANRRVQFFFKDAVDRSNGMIKEVEKLGFGSIASTLKSTEQMVAQTKTLTLAIADRFRHGSKLTSTLLFSQRQNLARDISSYSRKMSSLFTQQAKGLTDVASKFSVFAIGQEIQAYRETHFRQTQINMLRAWWKISGAPARRRARQDLEDEDVWGDGSSKRKRVNRPLRRYVGKEM